MVRKLLIIAAVVVALSLASLFLPARQMSIEGIGKLSFETKITLSAGSEVAYASPDSSSFYSSTSDGNIYASMGTYSGTQGATSGTVNAGAATFTIGQRATTSTQSQTSRNSYTSLYSGTGSYIRAAERVNSFVGTITSVQWYLCRSGSPTGTGSCTVRSVTGDTLLGTIGTINVSTLSTSPTYTWYTFNATPVGVDTATDVRICFEYSGGNSSNYVRFGYRNSNATTWGVYSRYTSSWTDSTSYDATFQNITYATYQVDRGFVFFDTSPIPDGATITSVSLGLYGQADSSATDFDITITNGQPTSPSDPLVGTDFNKNNYSGSGGTFNTAGFTTSGYNTITLNSTGQGWINKTGTTKLCLRSSRDISSTTPTGNEYVSVYASEQTGTSQDPQLTVTYTTPPPPACWLSGWAKRVRLSIDTGDIDPSLSTFPVLVYLSAQSGRGPDDVTFVFNELGSYDNRLKIAVTTDDCTECFVEIEKWDQTNKQAWLWVRVPDISNTTELHLYYDSTHANNTTYVGDTNSTPAETVWDSNFVMVQHLGENATVVHDSTANNNDETNPPPAPPSPGYIRATYNDPGRINGCYSFSNDGTNGSRIQMAHSSSLNITDSITLEAFVYLNDKTDAKFIVKDDPFDIGGSGCYNLQQEALSGVPNLQLQLDLGGWARASYATYNTGQWLYVVGTYDRQTMRLYLNGTEVATNPQTAAIRSSSTVNVALGNRADDNGILYDLNGLLDEARVSNTARTPAWIKASYESGRDDLFDFGPEEGLNIENTPEECNFGTVSTSSTYDSGLTYFTVTNNSGGAINISIKGTDMSDTQGGTPWTLSDDGTPGPTSYGLWAGLEGGNDYPIIVKKNEPFNNLVTTLPDGKAQGWGLQLRTPTSFSDVYTKSGTVTLTAIFS